MTTESDFLNFMRSVDCGIASGEIIADDKIHRYQVEGDKPRKLNGAYQLRVDPDGFAVGWCKNWRNGELHTYTSKTKRKASPDEKAEWKRKAEEARAKTDAVRLELAERAAGKAQRQWAGMTRAVHHPYLTRKGIKPHMARVNSTGQLVVPLYRDGMIVGLQYIPAEEGGLKLFTSGCMKKGASALIAGDSDVVYICEGFATASSVSEATGKSVVIAFDAGNLIAVAPIVRDKFPDARIVIAADNDGGMSD